MGYQVADSPIASGASLAYGAACFSFNLAAVAGNVKC